MALGFSTLNHSTMFGLPNQLADQVRAAAAAGFDAVALDIFSLRATVAEGGLADLAAALDDTGLAVLDVCALSLSSDEAVFRAELDELLAVADRVRPQHVMIRFESLDTTAIDRARHVGRALSGAGVTLVVEPSPVGTVGTLSQALRLVRDVRLDGFGIVLDSWHVFVGGYTFADVAAVVPHLAYVQIADGTPPGDRDPVAQTMHHRRQPAEGTFDLGRLVEVLDAEGFTGPWCTEVLDERDRAGSVDAFARTSYRRLVDLIGPGEPGHGRVES